VTFLERPAAIGQDSEVALPTVEVETTCPKCSSKASLRALPG
jgi:hypothetical protein